MSEAGFYNSPENVRQYIKMCKGYDGSALISTLNKYLKPGSTLLELGIGPGTDLDTLKDTYKVTGSDNSQVFLDLYREKHENADLLLLDAVSIDTDRKFDCIYSNKVLHHLERSDLDKSLRRQIDILNDSGIVFHTFWKGEKEEFIQDLRFTYYTIDQLNNSFKPYYEVLTCNLYQELEPNDSILMVARKI